MMIGGYGSGQTRQQTSRAQAVAMPRRWGRQSSFSMLGMLLWALGMTALLSGCLTQSIHPIYSDDTLVFDERLIGSFEDDDGVWTFSRDGALTLAAMDSDWVEDHLKAFPETTAYALVDDVVLLTAQTERLQAFIGAHVRNADAWSDPEDYERLPLTERR